MIPRQLGRVLFYVLLLSTVVPSAWSQTPEIDPQALVGRWSGSCRWRQAVRASTKRARFVR